MRVVIVCPAPPGSRLGNRITALRWKRIMAELGHDVRITTGIPRGRWDVLLALHARRSAQQVRWARETHPARAVVVALTGTDLCYDIFHDASARRSLELADLLVVLHDKAREAVPREFRPRVRVVRQSAEPLARGKQTRSSFDVAFVAHLRPEKDPLRAALATRLVRPESQIRVVHVGRALTEELRVAADREQKRNPRYRWLGEVSPPAARKLILASRVLVLTSVMEGGANVLGEAIMCGTPVIASRIPATVAALGADYRGLFPVGDTRALARLLERAERDPKFLSLLSKMTRANRRSFSPAVEKAAWRKLLSDVTRQVNVRRRRADREPLLREHR